VAPSFAGHNSGTLEVTVADSPTPVRLTIDKELTIGRAHPTQTAFIGLDLSPFRGAELGVSHLHALIRREGDRLFVVDLNSLNGTYLNHLRLEPERPYPLTNGDRLHIGQVQITLNLTVETVQTSIKAQRSALDLQAAPAMGHGQRFLVVEGQVGLSLKHLTALKYLTAIQLAGFTVQVFPDVDSAIQGLNQDAPELVLIDQSLLGTRGLELCHYVRQNAEFYDIPVVVVGTESDKEAVQQAMDAGADIYFAKPVNMTELVRAVSALIYEAEAAHPTQVTKRLAGMVSLKHISAASRPNTLVFLVDGHRDPVSLTVVTASILGRQKTGSSETDILNLGPFGAFDKGVSRTHARIVRQDNAFLVEDLDSANGTFVNGQLLHPHESHRLRSGDELRLGELRMRVFYLEEPPADTA